MKTGKWVYKLKTSKIKILFIIGSLGLGGKERQLSELIKGLPEDEYEIYLLTKLNTTPFLRTLKKRVLIHKKLNKNRFNISSLPEIYRFIKDVNPHIVHSWAAPASVFTLLIRFYKPTFFAVDGSVRNIRTFKAFSFPNILRVFINLFSDLIVTNSYRAVDSFALPKRKTKVIHNGFDIDRISSLTQKIDIIKKYKVCTPHVVGMVGRFQPQKDWDTFFTSAAKILQERSDISFIAVGGGATFKHYKKKYGNVTNKNACIIFTGRTEIADSIARAFDIGVLTSFAEGFPNTIMEFMALEIPVIATDIGGVSELMVHDENGLIINVGDSQQLYEAICLLIDDPERLNIFGKRGKSRLLAMFNLGVFCKRYDRIYKGLTNR